MSPTTVQIFPVKNGSSDSFLSNEINEEFYMILVLKLKMTKSDDIKKDQR